MAIQWGPWTGSNFDDFRVGIDLSVSGTTITAKYYVGCLGAAEDNQTLHKSDAISGTTDYYCSIPSGGGTQHIVTNTRSGSRGTTYTFDASISGIYSGVSPSKNNASITVPSVKPGKVSKPSVPSSRRDSYLGHAWIEWSKPWDGGATIDEYDVLCELPSGTNVDHEKSGTDMEQRMEGLEPGQEYTARVRAHNTNGWGDWSDKRSFTMPSIEPSTPEQSAHSEITTTGVRVNYSIENDGGASIDKAEIRHARNSDMTSSVHTHTDNSGFTWYDGIDDLSPGTKYWTDVRAHNSVGWSDRSSPRSFTTDAELPEVGDPGDPSDITRNSARIATPQVLDNGGESPTDVRVQHNTSESESGATEVTRGSFSSTTIDGLSALTQYYYRQAVWNSAGWSDYSEWQSFTTLDDAPDDVDSPTFSSVDDTSFQVDWVAPNMNGATFEKYRVEVALSDTFASLEASGTTTDLFMVFEDLTPGTKYYVRVKAEASPNDGGWGVSSQETTGVAPNSGLRVYTFIGGERKKCTVYTFVDGERKQLAPMYVHDGGVVETE